MRLLKTNPSQPGLLEFETFYEPELPRYCILSHTWSPNADDEVLYADIVAGAGPNKFAYRKIQATIRQAKQDGYSHCWVDTCCIDKNSSAELSEALNSMWRWYSCAQECYAYLADVEDGSQIEGSRWFTRGWTLQELLAPIVVTFHGAGWINDGNNNIPGAAGLGTKKTLQSEIFQITGIQPAVLSGERGIQSFSIAQRIS